MIRICCAMSIILGAIAAGHGCGTARRGEPFAGPLIIHDEQVALGQRAFMTSCHQCHPGGTAGLGPAINDKPLPGFMIELQVRQGLGAMPAFSESELSPEQLDAIVAYLKTLRKHG